MKQRSHGCYIIKHILITVSTPATSYSRLTNKVKIQMLLFQVFVKCVLYSNSKIEINLRIEFKVRS